LIIIFDALIRLNNMQRYFNVNLEFDRSRVNDIIHKAIENNRKGYVCSIESNNLTVANQNKEFNHVVNNSLVNICDGSILALILGKIHHKSFKPYIGADLFIEYIKEKKYKQYFLGNTKEVLDGLKSNLRKIDPDIEQMTFRELPFRKINEFDYKSIADDINRESPDIIWVSLGAPKQEFFMHNLLPYLNRGIMFGFGAIFNFNSGTGHVKRAPSWMRKLKLEWLYRASEEPKKNVPRYWNFAKKLPILISEEIRQAK